MARPHHPAGGRPRRTREPVTRTVRIGLTEAEHAQALHAATVAGYRSLATWARAVLVPGAKDGTLHAMYTACYGEAAAPLPRSATAPAASRERPEDNDFVLLEDARALTDAEDAKVKAAYDSVLLRHLSDDGIPPVLTMLIWLYGHGQDGLAEKLLTWVRTEGHGIFLRESRSYAVTGDPVRSRHQMGVVTRKGYNECYSYMEEELFRVLFAPCSERLEAEKADPPGGLDPSTPDGWDSSTGKE